MIIKHNPRVNKVAPKKEQPIKEEVLVEEVREPVKADRFEREPAKEMKLVYSKEEDKIILVEE